jgi:transposase
LLEDRLPESWIPPDHVLEVRMQGRVYVAVMNQRRAWQQRIQAQLFHQGVEKRSGLLTAEGRAYLQGAELSAAGPQMVEVALRIIDALGVEADLLRDELKDFARRQPGCRALVDGLFGVGELTAAILWAEMGDTRRFSSSDQAVRHSGLDVTVYESDQKRSPGRLSRQGPPALRWALFEAALPAARSGSPDHGYFLDVRERVGAKRAYLSVARKLARRIHHILRSLGDAAWQPVT